MLCEIKTQWCLVRSFTASSLLDQLGTMKEQSKSQQDTRYIYLYVSLISSYKMVYSECLYVWRASVINMQIVYIKTFKIASKCFDPKIIFRELHCSLLKSYF